MNDGYSLEQLMDRQMEINHQIKVITREMNNMELPENIEVWLDSLTDDKGFKLSDFKRMFSMDRRLRNLMEEKMSNASKLKIAVIDKIMERIGKTLDGK